MHRFNREDGATAVVVSLSLVVLLGIGALAVDAGSLWSTKRDFHAGTDAAALAASRYLHPFNCHLDPETDPDLRELVESVYQANVDDVDLPELQIIDEGRCGKVRVSYLGDAQSTFSSVLGVDDLEVYADTTASPGAFLGGGLRPLSICMGDASAVVSPPPPHDDDFDLFDLEQGDVLRFSFGNQFSGNADAGPCGSASGNWGWTCFDKDVGTDSCPNNNSVGNLVDMLTNGYSGDVDLGSDPADCQHDQPENGSLDCEMRPGDPSGSGIHEALRGLIDANAEFAILGIDGYSEDLNGANARVTPSAFVGVRLTSYGVSGGSPNDTYPNPANKSISGNIDWLQLTVVNLFDEGSSAVATGGVFRRTPPVICGVDHQPGSVDYCEQ